MRVMLQSGRTRCGGLFLLFKYRAGVSNGFDGAHKVRWTLVLGGPERSGDREA